MLYPNTEIKMKNITKIRTLIFYLKRLFQEDIYQYDYGCFAFFILTTK